MIIVYLETKFQRDISKIEKSGAKSNIFQKIQNAINFEPLNEFTPNSIPSVVQWQSTCGPNLRPIYSKLFIAIVVASLTERTHTHTHIKYTLNNTQLIFF